MTGWLVRIAASAGALLGRALAPIADLVLRFLPEGLRARWFGSDVLVGSTTNYTWTANQFGHFTIGLALFFLLSRILDWITSWLTPSLASEIVLGILALILAIVLYAVKETADAQLARVPGQQFAVDDTEIRLDGFADTFFVGFGAAFLLSAGFDWLSWAIVTAALGVIALLLACFYLPRADCFDFSNLPQYFRLQLFQGEVREPSAAGLDKPAATELVTAVARNESDVDALLVTGDHGTGRTSLVIGIGTRLALAKVKLRFIAAGKLGAAIAEELALPTKDKHLRAYNYDVWAPRQVTHVVIDDAPAADADGYLADLPEEVRAWLAERRLVIVLAGAPADPAPVIADWTAALTRLKPEAKVAAVIAVRKVDERARNTA